MFKRVDVLFAASACGVVLFTMLLSWTWSSRAAAPPPTVPPGEPPADEVRAIYDRSAALEREAQGQKLFETVLDETEGALLQGGLSLTEASDRVCAAARRDYPVYLDQLRLFHPGDNDRERAKHNLVRRVQAGIDVRLYPPRTEALVQRLRQELRSSSSSDSPPEPNPTPAPAGPPRP